ncbi:NADH oxidoreductase [Caviibacterium pharyngocola]|uniref:NADH oxidoreductase n=1 Tax=Caviibacterium pharyngocola TaxID=28159 RepID=A0A2M8RXB6_9PAST|nr:NADH oxidoreductase [Caviibacterium pharyngocola]PJG83532.1 NADH oxidoreductase [Caviibacterium pharyngocola]
MSNPNPLCTNEMQVHSIVQETDDVYTLELIAQDFYPYEPGQYALISIKNTPDIARAYTLSSTPGISRFITLTVRRIPNGIGSNWITSEVKVGDSLWLSDPMGEFTCAKIHADRYLLVAGGCGVTPIMSMTRWLLVNKPDVAVTVIYSVHSPKDVIFKREWQLLKDQYPQLQLFMNTSTDVEEGFRAGRISPAMLSELVPNIADYTVLTCGPESYMKDLQAMTESLGVPPERFFLEQFHSSAENCLIDNSRRFTLSITNPVEQTFSVPVGMTLLAALEEHKQPIIAACRSGICGSCKTKIIRGDYETDSQATLTETDIAEGYVLACSCRLKGNVTVDLMP